MTVARISHTIAMSRRRRMTFRGKGISLSKSQHRPTEQTAGGDMDKFNGECNYSGKLSMARPASAI